MNSYEKIRGLLMEALQTEGKTGGEQAGRANLSRIPHTRDTRRQARGLGPRPHEKPDSGEGSPEDVQRHQTQTKKSRVSGMPAAQKLSLLRIAAQTATGIKLSRIEAMIRKLEGEGNGERAMNASTENAYSKLHTLLIEKKSKFKHGPEGMSKDDPRYEEHQKALRARGQRARSDQWERAGIGQPSVADVAGKSIRNWMHNKPGAKPVSQAAVKRFKKRFGRMPKI